MNPPRIIVVDDEEDVATYLAAALEDEGYETIAFTEASPAIEEIRRRKPDLVCVDLLMPGHTGLWLYRRLREMPSLAEVPVMVVTGLNVQKGLRSLMPGEDRRSVPEPDAWIEKPVDLERLVSAARRLTSAPVEGEA